MEIGDAVTWTSQAQGSGKTKKGNVIAIVNKKQSAKALIPAGEKSSHIKFDTDRSFDKDRVLVAVPAGKDGQITHYYCPSKSMLIIQGNF